MTWLDYYFFFNQRTAAFKAYCAIWVRRSNFRHQASPRVSPRESTQRWKVQLWTRNVRKFCPNADVVGLQTGEKTSVCEYTTAFVSFIVNQSLWRQKTICLVVTAGRGLGYRRRKCFSQNTDYHIFVYPHVTTKPHTTANFISR